MKKVPNMLTIVRFILVPFFGYYLYHEFYQISIILYLVGGFTDILDGYLARKFNSITAWGKIADPVADKLLQTTAILMLTLHGMIPLPILIIVLLKELFMGIGSLLLYKNVNFVVKANWYGKVATIIFYIPIFLTILLRYINVHNTYYYMIITFLYWLAIVITLYALFMYTKNYLSVVNENKES